MWPLFIVNYVSINVTSLSGISYWSNSDFIRETRLGGDRISDQGMILIHILTENRLRHTSGPVQLKHRFLYINTAYT